MQGSSSRTGLKKHDIANCDHDKNDDDDGDDDDYDDEVIVILGKQ